MWELIFSVVYVPLLATPQNLGRTTMPGEVIGLVAAKQSAATTTEVSVPAGFVCRNAVSQTTAPDFDHITTPHPANESTSLGKRHRSKETASQRFRAASRAASVASTTSIGASPQ